MSASNSVQSLFDFSELNLSDWLVERCTEKGISKPTPVQQHLIPKILEGQNYICVSNMGSGKTLVYVLPILQKLLEDPYGIFALIIAPTRPLAFQISEVFLTFGNPANVEVSVLVGGMDMVAQGSQIHSKPHIVVATPGRLVDLLQSGYQYDFKRIKVLVLDEADRLLEGQFTGQLEVIFEALPEKRLYQTLLFSATMTKELENLQSISSMESFIWTTEADASTVEKLDQQYVLLPQTSVKDASLVQVIYNFQKEHPDKSIIIFTENYKQCQLISNALKCLRIDNVALNSNLKQWERRLLSKFKLNQIKILIATDVASRGLDYPMVGLVINYSVPLPTNYLYRVGRTARAGRNGSAITLVTDIELVKLKNIEKEINTQITELKLSEVNIGNILANVQKKFRKAEKYLEDQDHLWKRKRSTIVKKK